MAPGYTCDVYRLSTIEEKLGLSRAKMVALSLLTGCDYTSGVHRIGKETAIKYLKTIPDDQVFKRYTIENYHYMV
jgi:5'-3' exonuclease